MNKQNSGAVLIYVLLISVFLASALTLLQMNTGIFIKRFDSLLKESESKYMALGTILMTQAVLEEDSKNSAVDGVGDKWWNYRELKSFPIDGGKIAFSINDALEYPNFNEIYMSNESRQQEFRTFLKSYFRSQGIPTRYIDVAIDWVDSDNRVYGSGAEKYTYLSNDPAYSPPNTFMSSVAETVLFNGYSDQYADALNDKLSYLPDHAKVNVNTVNKSVLTSLLKGASPSGINKAISNRKRKAYLAIGDFFSDIGYEESIKGVEFAAYSTYFNLEANVEINNSIKRISALLERTPKGVVVRRILWL